MILKELTMSEVAISGLLPLTDMQTKPLGTNSNTTETGFSAVFTGIQDKRMADTKVLNNTIENQQVASTLPLPILNDLKQYTKDYLLSVLPVGNSVKSALNEDTLILDDVDINSIENNSTLDTLGMLGEFIQQDAETSSITSVLSKDISQIADQSEQEIADLMQQLGLNDQDIEKLQQLLLDDLNNAIPVVASTDALTPTTQGRQLAYRADNNGKLKPENIMNTVNSSGVDVNINKTLLHTRETEELDITQEGYLTVSTKSIEQDSKQAWLRKLLTTKDGNNLPLMTKEGKAMIVGVAQAAQNTDIAQEEPVHNTLLNTTKLNNTMMGQASPGFLGQLNNTLVKGGNKDIGKTSFSEKGWDLVENKLSDINKVLETREARAVQTPPTVQNSLEAKLQIGQHVQTPEWSERLGERIDWMTKNQMQRAEIKLNPEELGPLSLKVNVKHEQVNIQIQANHVVTRDILENALPRLREMLAESGFLSVDVNVSEQSQQQEKSEQAFTAQDTEEELELEEQTDTIRSTVIPDLVNYYA